MHQSLGQDGIAVEPIATVSLHAAETRCDQQQEGQQQQMEAVEVTADIDGGNLEKSLSSSLFIGI